MPEPPFAVYYFTVGNVDFPVANRAILVELAHFFTHCCGGGTRINALVVCHADCSFLLDRFGLRPTAMRGVIQAHPQRAEQPAAAGGAGAFPYDHVYRAPAEARRKAPGKLPLLLPRAYSFPGSLLASSLPAPVYILAAEPGYRIRFPRQDTPAPNRLAQVDWMLDASRQQSRQAGWKESNMQYRGTLTYHL